MHHLAMRTSHRNWFDLISYIYRCSSSSKQFWNKIKMSKDRSNQSYDKISINTLSEFYKERFSKYLSDIFTLCVRFGVLPDTFYCGILVPILKKPNIDPSIAKHYCPIVISTVFSKLMEMAILEFRA